VRRRSDGFSHGAEAGMAAANPSRKVRARQKAVNAGNKQAHRRLRHRSMPSDNRPWMARTKNDVVNYTGKLKSQWRCDAQDNPKAARSTQRYSIFI